MAEPIDQNRYEQQFDIETALLSPDFNVNSFIQQLGAAPRTIRPSYTPTPETAIPTMQAPASIREQRAADLRAEQAAPDYTELEKQKLDWKDAIRDVADAPLEYIPVLNYLTFFESARLIKDAMSLKAGTASPESKDRLTEFVKREADRSQRGSTFGYKVVKTLANIPSWLTDFAISRGAIGAAGRAITRKAVKAVGKEVAGEVAETAIRKAAGTSMRDLAMRYGVGPTIRTAFLPHRVAQTMAQKVTGDLQLAPNEAGELEAIATGEGDDFGVAFAKAYGLTATEILTEELGEFFMPISQAIGGKINDLFRMVFANRWLATHPGSTVGQLRQLIARGGWHGLLSEMAEERAGDVLRPTVEAFIDAASGQKSFSESLTKNFQLPTLEELGAEAAAFAIFGSGVSIADQQLAKRREMRQVSRINQKPQAATAFSAELSTEAAGERQAIVQEEQMRQPDVLATATIVENLDTATTIDGVTNERRALTEQEKGRWQFIRAAQRMLTGKPAILMDGLRDFAVTTEDAVLYDVRRPEAWGLGLFGHELFHEIANQRDVRTGNMLDELGRYVDEQASVNPRLAGEINRLKELYRDNYSMLAGRDVAAEEIPSSYVNQEFLAGLFGSVVNDIGFWDAMLENNPALFTNLHEKVKDTLDSIEDFYAKNPVPGPGGMASYNNADIKGMMGADQLNLLREMMVDIARYKWRQQTSAPETMNAATVVAADELRAEKETPGSEEAIAGPMSIREEIIDRDVRDEGLSQAGLDLDIGEAEKLVGLPRSEFDRAIERFQMGLSVRVTDPTGMTRVIIPPELLASSRRLGVPVEAIMAARADIQAKANAIRTVEKAVDVVNAPAVQPEEMTIPRATSRVQQKEELGIRTVEAKESEKAAYLIKYEKTKPELKWLTPAEAEKVMSGNSDVEKATIVSDTLYKQERAPDGTWHDVESISARIVDTGEGHRNYMILDENDKAQTVRKTGTAANRKYRWVRSTEKITIDDAPKGIKVDEAVIAQSASGSQVPFIYKGQTPTAWVTEAGKEIDKSVFPVLKSRKGIESQMVHRAGRVAVTDVEKVGPDYMATPISAGPYGTTPGKRKLFKADSGWQWEPERVVIQKLYEPTANDMIWAQKISGERIKIALDDKWAALGKTLGVINAERQVDKLIEEAQQQDFTSAALRRRLDTYNTGQLDFLMANESAPPETNTEEYGRWLQSIYFRKYIAKELPKRIYSAFRSAPITVEAEELVADSEVPGPDQNVIDAEERARSEAIIERVVGRLDRPVTGPTPIGQPAPFDPRELTPIQTAIFKAFSNEVSAAEQIDTEDAERFVRENARKFAGLSNETFTVEYENMRGTISQLRAAAAEKAFLAAEEIDKDKVSPARTKEAEPPRFAKRQEQPRIQELWPTAYDYLHRTIPDAEMDVMARAVFQGATTLEDMSNQWETIASAARLDADTGEFQQSIMRAGQWLYQKLLSGANRTGDPKESELLEQKASVVAATMAMRLSAAGRILREGAPENVSQQFVSDFLADGPRFADLDARESSALAFRAKLENYLQRYHMTKTGGKISKQELATKALADLKQVEEVIGVRIDGNLVALAETDPRRYRQIVSDYIRQVNTQTAGFGEQLLEAYRSGLLWSPSTWLTQNPISNFLNTLYEFGPKRLMEAAVSSLLGVAGKRQPTDPTFGEFGHVWRAAWLGQRRAWHDMLNAYSSEMSVHQGEGSFGGVRLGQYGQKIPGKFGGFWRHPLRSLMAGDEYFKSLIKGMEAAGRAYRKAISDPVISQNKDAVDEFIFKEMTDRKSSSYQDPQTIAKSLEITWQNQPIKPTQLLNNIRAKSKLMQFMFPFTTTPSNILTSGLRKTPLGTPKLMMDIYQYVYGSNDPAKLPAMRRKVIEGMAEQALAWGLVIALYDAIGGDDERPEQQWITGGRPLYKTVAPGKITFERQEIAPPKHIYIPAIKKYVDYSRLEPLSTILPPIVDWLTAFKKTAIPEKRRKALLEAYGKSLSSLSDQTFFGTMVDYFNMLEDPREWEQQISNFISSWSPNIVRSAIRAADPYERETQIKGEMGSGERFYNLWRQIKYRALPINRPFGPPPKVDIWGKDITKLRTQPNSDTWYKLYEFTGLPRLKLPKENQLSRMILNWNNQNPGKEWWPVKPLGYVTGNKIDPLTGKKARYYLTDQQYYRFQKEMGSFFLNTASELIDRFNVDKPTAAMIGLLRDKIHPRARVVASKKILQEFE